MDVNSLLFAAIRRNALPFRVGCLLHLTALATILITSHAFAEPLGTYCVSQIGQKPHQPKHIERTKEPAQVAFTAQGKSFRLVAAPNSRHLVELIDENGSHLAQVWVGQSDFGGGIESLALGKNGWLWIDGRGLDYLARIDFNQMPPVIGKPIQVGRLKPDSSDTWDTQFYFSNLMQHPCSYLAWIFGCLPAQGYYSPNLDRVFVSGYPVSLFGSSREVSYEIAEGQTKLLPESLQAATLLHEISINSISKNQAQRQNGVLFRSLNNEAIFYDGRTATPLLKKPSRCPAKDMDKHTRYEADVEVNMVSFMSTGRFALDSQLVQLLHNAA